MHKLEMRVCLEEPIMRVCASRSMWWFRLSNMVVLIQTTFASENSDNEQRLKSSRYVNLKVNDMRDKTELDKA